jgi:hypothetical protein
MRRCARWLLFPAALLACAAAAQNPRTSERRPSFEGVWTNASLTTLQRPARYAQLVLPPADVEAATESHPQVVRQRPTTIRTRALSSTARICAAAAVTTRSGSIQA